MNDAVRRKRKSSRRRNKKILLLFLMTGITAIVLVASTYAWFVGTGNVKVNSFAVNLKADNALEISLDGYTWDDEVTITENTIKAHSASGSAYEGNYNHWVGENGLVPVSSSGDNTLGRLDIYSKTAMTATNGGYRLVSNKLDNSLTEKDFYVTFDLFLMNKTGDVYNSTYNFNDDENIYMTTESQVTTSATGSSSYGVQNSARVAFVQVGRISLDELTGSTTPVIKCETPASGDKYTPLCNASGNIYSTVIWEPNDMAHDSRLINYYNVTCKNKTASGGTISYGENPCTSLSTYTMTNTVKRNVLSSDNVDIYDGLNGYTDSIQADSNTTTKPLQATRTFTDTMKVTDGDYTFMKLHPHSVTKIRVYIYLEGQDVDNYDLITNDQNILVNFGFSKERTSYGNIQD